MLSPDHTADDEFILAVWRQVRQWVGEPYSEYWIRERREAWLAEAEGRGLDVEYVKAAFREIRLRTGGVFYREITLL